MNPNELPSETPKAASLVPWLLLPGSLCFRGQKTPQQHHVDSPSESLLAIHRDHRHRGAVPVRQLRLTIDIYTFQGKAEVISKSGQDFVSIITKMAILSGK